MVVVKSMRVSVGRVICGAVWSIAIFNVSPWWSAGRLECAIALGVAFSFVERGEPVTRALERVG